MLVLMRHVDEQVVITTRGGEVIKIVVVDIRGRNPGLAESPKVRLGFDADTSVTIHRLEVWEAIQRENERIAQQKAAEAAAAPVAASAAAATPPGRPAA